MRGGAIPRCPKYILTKKHCAKFSLFCPEPCSGGLHQPFSGQQCPQTTSPPRQIPDSAYEPWVKGKGKSNTG